MTPLRQKFNISIQLQVFESDISIQLQVFESGICKLLAILFMHQSVNLPVKMQIEMCCLFTHCHEFINSWLKSDPLFG